MGSESNELGDLHSTIVPTYGIEQRILLIRGEKVILDSDLAELYGVETRRLNQHVRRNRDRFPGDFSFRLTNKEVAALMSHFATSNGRRGGRRKLPYAFTEHGAIMAASVLNTPRAVEMSVFVVRAFVRLRAFLATPARIPANLCTIRHFSPRPSYNK